MSPIASLPPARLPAAHRSAGSAGAPPSLARRANGHEPGRASSAHAGQRAGAARARETDTATPHPASPPGKAGFLYEIGPGGRLYASSGGLVIEARPGDAAGGSPDAKAAFPLALRQAAGDAGFIPSGTGADRAEASRAPFLALYAANQAGWPTQAPRRVDVFA